LKQKTLWVLIGLLLLLPISVGLTVFIGLGDVHNPAILHLRLARVLGAGLAGAALAVSGAILQAILRNPLADPYVLGISAGGGLGATLMIVVGGVAALGTWSVPAAAFAGSVATIFLVYALARKGGKAPAHSLLLSGVVVGAVFGSLMMFMVSTMKAETLHSVTGWLLGDTEIQHAPILYVLIAAVAAGIGVALLFSRDLNVMVLGEEPAAHLGLHVERVKKMFFVLSSLVTGATVAACGLIGFVGLIVPHMVRMAIGPDHRYLIPASVLGGASFLILADLVAHVVMPPEVVPIGVITAFIGGPFFIFLLRRRKRAYWG
jgi:iron complex transport system permease protein